MQLQWNADTQMLSGMDDATDALARGLLGSKRPIVDTEWNVVGKSTPATPRQRGDGRWFSQCRAGGVLSGCEVITAKDGAQVLQVAATPNIVFHAPWPLNNREDAQRYFHFGVTAGVPKSTVAKTLGWSGYGATAAAETMVARVLGLLRSVPISLSVADSLTRGTVIFPDWDI